MGDNITEYIQHNVRDMPTLEDYEVHVNIMQTFERTFALVNQMSDITNIVHIVTPGRYDQPCRQ